MVIVLGGEGIGRMDGEPTFLCLGWRGDVFGCFLCLGGGVMRPYYGERIVFVSVKAR